MVCRSIENQEKMLKSIKFPADKQNKYIYVFTDEDIIQFMEWKLNREEYRINQFLEEKFKYLIEE
jgi:hypothetical protein